MTNSGYDRVTVVTNSDTEERQSVATVVLLLSQIRTLSNTTTVATACHSSLSEFAQAVVTFVLLDR
jgi:hypothetical protein